MHHSGNTVIENYTGDIFITNRADDQDIFIRTEMVDVNTYVKFTLVKLN